MSAARPSAYWQRIILGTARAVNIEQPNAPSDRRVLAFAPSGPPGWEEAQARSQFCKSLAIGPSLGQRKKDERPPGGGAEFPAIGSEKFSNYLVRETGTEKAERCKYWSLPLLG